MGSKLDRLLEVVNAFRKSRIILTAFELEIFSVLGNEELTAAAMARKIRADFRATDRLLNALVTLRLLKKKKGCFRNSPIAKRYLVKGQPGYLAGLYHSLTIWNNWNTLTAAVLQGGTVQRDLPTNRAEKELEGFIAAMHWRSTWQAREVISLLDLAKVSKTLDIGAGSGAYSLALVQAKKDIHATVFDLPDVIPITRFYVKQAGMSERFHFRKGDFNRDDFGSGYDLIILSAIVHMNSAQQNINLFKKAARALKKGGRLVIQDYIMSPDRLRPPLGTFFALNMLVATPAGDTFTENEIRVWLKKAKFMTIVRKQTTFEASLLIAKKGD